jgi:hypothetical protein
MKTNTNTQAIDQIVSDFKTKFRSFWDTIPSEPWVDWALRGMVLTEVRRMRKRKAAEDQKAGGKKDRHKAMPESSDNDADDPCHNEAADTDAEEGSRGVSAPEVSLASSLPLATGIARDSRCDVGGDVPDACSGGGGTDGTSSPSDRTEVSMNAKRRKKGNKSV